MADNRKTLQADEARRDFLRTAGKMAVAAPAAALLLSAHAKPARAGASAYEPVGDIAAQPE